MAEILHATQNYRRPYRLPVWWQDMPNSRRIVRRPGKIKTSDFDALWVHGGYPEPFIKRDIRFSRRWRNLRTQQMLREDVRDLTQIHHLGQLETLVRLLSVRSAHQLVYNNLAREVRVSVDTVRRWIDTLCNLHMGFLVRPWFKNISRSLRKEPKWFLRDWAVIDDPGDRAETFIACHLLKADVHYQVVKKFCDDSCRPVDLPRS